MDELRKDLLLRLRRESLKKRMPCVVLIMIIFLLYNFLLPLELLKWASLAVLLIYLGIGFHYRQKIKKELDKIPYEEPEEPQDH